MNVDLTIALAVLGLSALVLHYKSHVKFVAMGVFIGLVLLEAIPIKEFVVDPVATSVVGVALLVVPALVLGINHTVDKRKTPTLWTAAFVLAFTLFFLASLAQFLPVQYEPFIREHSVIGWRALTNYYDWYTLAAAVLILADSIPHRHHMEKQKSKSKSKSSKSKGSSS